MWLLSRWSWKFSRFLSRANLSEYIYAQLFNCWQYILKVSDTQFSLTASYILAFMWHDKRIFFKEPPKATTHVLDYNALKKIWTPKLKVENWLCIPKCLLPRSGTSNTAAVTTASATTRSLLELWRWMENHGSSWPTPREPRSVVPCTSSSTLLTRRPVTSSSSPWCSTSAWSPGRWTQDSWTTRILRWATTSPSCPCCPSSEPERPTQ